MSTGFFCDNDIDDAHDDSWHGAPHSSAPAANSNRSINIPISRESVNKFADHLRKRVGLAFVVSKLVELRRIASELFEETHVEISCDPEIEDRHYVVFSVLSAGTPRDVANLRREWYRRTDAVLGDDCDKVQLLIDSSRE